MTGSPLAAFHRSNLLTYASLVSAIAAMAAAARGTAWAAGALVALSVIADTFDGRFARLFDRTAMERSFGMQLDSLSDAIAFGVTPCVCMALLATGLDGWAALGWWVAVAIFAGCAITRLAFYNVTNDTAEGFVGMPAPVAALVWSSALLLNPGPLASAFVLLVTAVAMVAPLPFPRPSGAGLAAFVAWPLVVLGMHFVS